jgi:AhpD family alkylhydroperoxidase
VLSGCNDLQTAFGRTLDATKHGIALVFTEVNGCPYCKAVHTFAATTFGKIPADELELLQQAAPRSLSTAPPPPSRRRQSKSHGKVSDADLEAVR